MYTDLPFLSPEDRNTIIPSLEALPPSTQKTVLDIGLIVSDVSTKAAIAYFQVVTAVLKYISPHELSGWAGMGIQIAKQKSAAGVRYFSDGVYVFSKMPDLATRAIFMELGAKEAARDPNRALIYYQCAPLFLAEVTTNRDALHEWARHGFALADYTLAVEYFKAAPSLLQHLPMTHLASWVEVAKELADAKLIFAITFIRVSQEIVSVLQMELAKRPHEDLPPTECFPTLVKSWLGRIQQMIAIDIEAAQKLFLNAPRILAEVGPKAFIKWIDHGITLCTQGQGRGYFTGESKAAKTFSDHLKGGVLLASCANLLRLFASGISGRSVVIQPVELESAPPITDGQTIYLSPHVAFFEDDTRNFEWYKVATAFQAGYLEFGTFWPDPEKTAALIRSRKGTVVSPSLVEFLAAFTNATLIKQLFDLAEGARVLFLLKAEYPGLATILARDQHILSDPSPKTPVVAFLHQIAWLGKTQDPIPEELRDTVFECCRILGAVQSHDADVTYSMRAAAAVYDLLVDPDMPTDLSKPMESFEETGDKVKGTGTESGRVIPSVRGAIDPKRVENKRVLLLKEMEGKAEDNSQSARDNDATGHVGVDHTKDVSAPTTATSGSRGTEVAVPRGYPEWDCERNDYRPGFCHVIERDLRMEEEAQGEPFVEQVMAEYGGTIKSLRRGFQSLVPQGVVWVKGTPEGETFDLDRLIENQVAVRTKRSPDERIYKERRRKERSVAAAFLVDLSGSTQQRLASGKTILQVEKEALILLTQAIDTLGDRFALYGFSGRGNNAVEFYILKGFQDRLTRLVNLSIGRMNSLRQNRDGAAIRHATAKLAGETAKTRILILLSDGRPLDDGYNGSYALADTKKALSEAKASGIHPFCITVDRSGAEYLKGMYGEVAYLVVDHVETLPERLPKIYKRLTT